MNIYDDFSKPIEYTRNGIISIGTFEALHLGHQKLLSNMLNVAKEKNLESYVLTFIESPKKINNEKNILELSDKLSMFEKLGIQNVILCNFNSNIKNLDHFAILPLISSLGCKSSRTTINSLYRQQDEQKKQLITY